MHSYQYGIFNHFTYLCYFVLTKKICCRAHFQNRNLRSKYIYRQQKQLKIHKFQTMIKIKTYFYEANELIKLIDLFLKNIVHFTFISCWALIVTADYMLCRSVFFLGRNSIGLEYIMDTETNAFHFIKICSMRFSVVIRCWFYYIY